MAEEKEALKEPTFGPITPDHGGPQGRGNEQTGLSGQKGGEAQTGETTSDASDASEAPEEDNRSEAPGDPRSPHQTQPPFREQY